MATIATGVNTGRLDFGARNFPTQGSLTLPNELEKPRVERLKDFAQNPYLGMFAAFVALCGAVAGLALAFTGSL